MSIIDLAFVVDDGKQIVLIHALGARISNREARISQFEPQSTSQKTTYQTYERANPLESFPVPLIFFMASDVYGAMLIEAGNRIAASILRAEDLSFVLCSNRWFDLKIGQAFINWNISNLL